MKIRNPMRLFRLLIVVLLPASSFFAQTACSNKSLVGTFAFSMTGTNVGAGLLFAMNGRFVADGAGQFRGKATLNVGGKITRGVNFTGTYTVDAGCGGPAIFVFATGNKANLDFVLADDGNEIFIIDSDDGTVESGIARKQFRRAGPIPKHR